MSSMLIIAGWRGPSLQRSDFIRQPRILAAPWSTIILENMHGQIVATRSAIMPDSFIRQSNVARLFDCHGVQHESRIARNPLGYRFSL